MADILRTILKSKIHRARVTETQLYYPGSITIDSRLMQAADILEGEKVEVLNLNTGARIETYAISGKQDSGMICLNGPAARSGYVGDEIIIITYALVQEQQATKFKPKVALVDDDNRLCVASIQSPQTTGEGRFLEGLFPRLHNATYLSDRFESMSQNIITFQYLMVTMDHQKTGTIPVTLLRQKVITNNES